MLGAGVGPTIKIGYNNEYVTQSDTLTQVKIMCVWCDIHWMLSRTDGWGLQTINTQCIIMFSVETLSGVDLGGGGGTEAPPLSKGAKIMYNNITLQ